MNEKNVALRVTAPRQVLLNYLGEVLETSSATRILDVAVLYAHAAAVADSTSIKELAKKVRVRGRKTSHASKIFTSVREQMERLDVGESLNLTASADVSITKLRYTVNNAARSLSWVTSGRALSVKDARGVYTSYALGNNVEVRRLA